ncbi:MAG: hypothetical protein IKQ77_04405 [Prevotella sp.]|nr:hypothetical protein [Prevotella sp.]
MNNYDDIVPNPKYDTSSGRAFDVYKRINGVAVVGTIEIGKDGVAVATGFKTKTAGVQMLKAAPGLNVLNASARAKIAKEIEIIKENLKKSSKITNCSPMCNPRFPSFTA